MTAENLAPAIRRRHGAPARELARWGYGVLGVLVIATVWELYKFLGPADGVVIGETRVLPRTTDLAMPHTWDMVARLFDPVTRSATANPLWLEVALAALTTLGIAAVGWLVGIIIGLAADLLSLAA